METLLLLVEAALVGALGIWMSLAVSDNWRHPKLNAEGVAMVVRFDLMAEQFPEDYSLISHRRIEDSGTIWRLFQAIRAAETLAAAALLLAALLLVLAAVGVASVALATGAAIVGTAFFTLIWGGFIIGGNYFAYWYCHQWAQSNHFSFLYWGFFVLVILMI